MNSQELVGAVPAVEQVVTASVSSIEAEKGKPAAAKRVANIIDDANYSLESRNTEIATVASAIVTSGVRCEVLKDEKTGADFIKVNANLLVINEYFKNSAIARSEWKARIYLKGKLVTHYKAKNTSKIVDKVTSLLAVSMAEDVTPAA